MEDLSRFVSVHLVCAAPESEKPLLLGIQEWRNKMLARFDKYKRFGGEKPGTLLAVDSVSEKAADVKTTIEEDGFVVRTYVLGGWKGVADEGKSKKAPEAGKTYVEQLAKKWADDRSEKGHVCKVCGKAYLGLPNPIFCGPECRKRYYEDYAANPLHMPVAGGGKEPEKPKERGYTCQWCRLEYPRGGDLCFCSALCASLYRERWGREPYVGGEVAMGKPEMCNLNKVDISDKADNAKPQKTPAVKKEEEPKVAYNCAGPCCRKNVVYPEILCGDYCRERFLASMSFERVSKYGLEHEDNPDRIYQRDVYLAAFGGDPAFYFVGASCAYFLGQAIGTSILTLRDGKVSGRLNGASVSEVVKALSPYKDAQPPRVAEDGGCDVV